MASSFRSFATSPLTKSSVRSTAADGHCMDAVRRRLLNAAERQGGALVPDVRGENIKFRARNRVSRTDALGFPGPVCVDEAWVSEKLSGNKMAYKALMKSVKSMFRASPI